MAITEHACDRDGYDAGSMTSGFVEGFLVVAQGFAMVLLIHFA